MADKQRVSLANGIKTRDTSLNKDALLKNCYVEESSGESTKTIKRPGFVFGFEGNTTGINRGIFYTPTDGFFYVAQNGSLQGFIPVSFGSFGAITFDVEYEPDDDLHKATVVPGLINYQVGDKITTFSNSISTYGSISSGSNQLHVYNEDGIVTGLTVQATGIPSGTIVNNVTGNVITLSANATSALSASPVKFIAPSGEDLLPLQVGQNYSYESTGKVAIVEKLDNNNFTYRVKRNLPTSITSSGELTASVSNMQGVFYASATISGQAPVVESGLDQIILMLNLPNGNVGGFGLETSNNPGDGVLYGFYSYQNEPFTIISRDTPFNGELTINWDGPSKTFYYYLDNNLILKDNLTSISQYPTSYTINNPTIGTTTITNVVLGT